MKKSFKNLLSVLLAMAVVFSLAACGGGTPSAGGPDNHGASQGQNAPQNDPQNQEKEPEVLGVYTNGQAYFTPEYYPTITLYSDGTFVFVENFYEGMAEYKGTYDEYGGVLTLTTDSKDYKTLHFDIDGDTLIFKDSVSGSVKGDLFIKDYKGPVLLGVYCNAVEGCSKEYYPSLTLYSDHTFELSENMYEGFENYSGVYYSDNGTLTMYVDSYRLLGHEETSPVDSIKFASAENGFELLTSLVMSQTGDLFTADPAEKPPVSESGEPQLIGVYTNAQTYFSDHANYPTLTLYDDMTCVLRENFFEGMETYTGRCDDEKGILTVRTDSKDHPEIKFTIVSDSLLILESDIIGSGSGDYFIRDYKEPLLVGEYQFECRDTDPLYYPALMLFSDHSFVLEENIYEGFEVYGGTYYEDYGTYTMYVDSYKILGDEAVSPHDSIEFSFAKNGLTLNTDLCMSVKGSFFVQVY